MQRISIPQRPDLERVAAEHGYDFKDYGGIPYWNDTAYYKFGLRQIEKDLEVAVREIESMCYEVLERASADETLFQRLKIPQQFWDFIADSWRQKDKDLYGRLDFGYDGQGPAKLYEYNADTPTALYETAIFQWDWLCENSRNGTLPKESDQFSEIHEDLVKTFAGLEIPNRMHFACLSDIADDKDDDRGTVDYLEECAIEAGLETRSLSLTDIGVDPNGKFTDLEDFQIETLFKLYPWEWIMEEEFSKFVIGSDTQFFEPPWKSILSNKGLLPLLWEMFQGHPNLIPSYFYGDAKASALSHNFVRKPLFSRRGQNVEIVAEKNFQIQTDGPYGAEGYIVQEFHSLPDFDGFFPVLGCWVVAGQPAGLGIREGQNLITTEQAHFVPHVILD
jgi:glutathionylspermidine synthase